jgi:hypothetical protein
MPALALALACCEDVEDAVRSGLPLAAEPQVQTFPADPRATYEAARKAIDGMGYTFVRGGPAQGTLEAVSTVGQGDMTGSSQQFTLRAKFEGTLDGKGTEVSVRMTEILEEDSEHHAGQGTETPLRDTALYESFFRRIGQALGLPQH